MELLEQLIAKHVTSNMIYPGWKKKYLILTQTMESQNVINVKRALSDQILSFLEKNCLQNSGIALVQILGMD